MSCEIYSFHVHRCCLAVVAACPVWWRCLTGAPGSGDSATRAWCCCHGKRASKRARTAALPMFAKVSANKVAASTIYSVCGPKDAAESESRVTAGGGGVVSAARLRPRHFATAGDQACSVHAPGRRQHRVRPRLSRDRRSGQSSRAAADRYTVTAPPPSRSVSPALAAAASCCAPSGRASSTGPAAPRRSLSPADEAALFERSGLALAPGGGEGAPVDARNAAAAAPGGGCGQELSVIRVARRSISRWSDATLLPPVGPGGGCTPAAAATAARRPDFVPHCYRPDLVCLCVVTCAVCALKGQTYVACMVLSGSSEHKKSAAISLRGQ